MKLFDLENTTLRSDEVQSARWLRQRTEGKDAKTIIFKTVIVVRMRRVEHELWLRYEAGDAVARAALDMANLSAAIDLHDHTATK